MTPRRAALLASSPALAVLLGSLAWALLDRLHLHAVDRGVRLLDRLRDVARF